MNEFDHLPAYVVQDLRAAIIAEAQMHPDNSSKPTQDLLAGEVIIDNPAAPG